ncbi:MAG: hypothetical protein ACE5IO_10260, partial [Thermoplasmata archaeon]
RVEEILMKSFDVLCVFNEQMKKAIIGRYDISDKKFVEFEILDYGVVFSPSKGKECETSRWTIVYAGGLDKKYLGEWVKDLPRSEAMRYEFIGTNGDWLSEINRGDFIYRGFMNPENLLNHISRNAHFGIIGMASDAWREYCNYGTTSKFSAYLSAGLPLVVSSEYVYISSLVKKYGIGLLFDSLNDISARVQDLSASDYERMRNRCLRLGERIRTGRFFKRAVSRAMNRLGMT